MRADKGRHAFPLWLRAVLTMFCFIFIVVYWRERGIENFLWFTDVAFFLIVIASWLGSSFLLSMAAVSVLLFEMIWNIDFFSKLLFDAHLFGMNATEYMFDPSFPTVIKTLSLVLHVSLPVMMIYMLIKLGYHRQAWKAQVGLLSLLLPFCYLFTEPERNINWVFGIGGVQSIMPGWLYILLQILLVPLVIYLPTHLLLSRIFKQEK